MKILRLLFLLGLFIGFLETKAQDNLQVKINSLNGVVQKGQATFIDLRFSNVNRESYENLIKKALTQTNFEIYGKGFNLEYSVAQLRLKSNSPKTLDDVEKFVALLGFEKIILSNKQIDTRNLSEEYHLRSTSEQERLTNKTK